MKALIVGGGIGGLSAALCLQRLGWSTTVLEQASSLDEVGAGLQISPNGCRILQQLGVMPALRAKAFLPQALEMRWGRSGRQIFEIPLQQNAEKRWDGPYLHLHRADLQDVLRQRLQELPNTELRTNARVLGYSQDDQGVRIEIEHAQALQGDLLIGADGVHSAMRHQMLGPSPAHFTGNVAWRAVVPMDRLGSLRPPPTACVWVGDGRHAVTYRLRGGTLANFVGVVEHEQWGKESWMQQGRRTEALADFSGWHPCIRRIIERASQHYRWALYDRPPFECWSEGRAVLLGDACHPMLPFLAQGAVMAIEDAWELSEQLRQHDDVAVANQAYFERRIQRTAQIQAGARGNSKTFHHAHPAAYLPVYFAARLMPWLLLKRFDWIYRGGPIAASQT